MGELVFDSDDLYEFILNLWPEKAHAYEPERIEVFEAGFCRMRYPVADEDLRPGGTVSGPTLMALADTAAYAIILGHLGDAALAVTTSLHIDFLRRPLGPTVVADCELVKLGRSLAVCRVTMASAEGGEVPDLERAEAIANVTYSLSLV